MVLSVAKYLWYELGLVGWAGMDYHCLMAITLAEYQRAAISTADPEAFRPDYLLPSLVGEIGELFGQRGKSVWHGWSEEKLRDALVLEYGDVAWMTAVLLHTMEERTTGDPITSDCERTAWDSLLSQSNLVYWSGTHPQAHGWLRNDTKLMWQTLAGNSQLITGAPFDYVLTANLDKLRSRAERGVLKGSGDYR